MQSGKFLGGGYRVPKEQSSSAVVDELIHTFTRAVSIPLVHAADLHDADSGLQTRRLAGREDDA